MGQGGHVQCVCLCSIAINSDEELHISSCTAKVMKEIKAIQTYINTRES